MASDPIWASAVSVWELGGASSPAQSGTSWWRQAEIETGQSVVSLRSLSLVLRDPWPGPTSGDLPHRVPLVFVREMFGSVGKCSVLHALPAAEARSFTQISLWGSIKQFDSYSDLAAVGCEGKQARGGGL